MGDVRRSALPSLVVLAIALSSTISCGTSPTQPNGGTPDRLVVRVDPGAIAVGETSEAFAGVPHGSGLTVVTTQTTWASTDSTVATIDGAGHVTPVAPGKADIQGSFNALSGKAPVRVLGPGDFEVFFAGGAGVGIRVDGSAVVNLSVGAGVSLRPRISYDRTSISITISELQPTTRATWASSNPECVGVSPTGDVRALALGTADITATWFGASAIAHVTVVQ